MSDADLVRYLDGELTLDERHHLDAVLAGDAALAQRLGVLRRRSARLSTLLASSSPSEFETAAANPSPRSNVTPISAARVSRKAERNVERSADASSGQRVWLRAAILLIAVLGGAMAVPPVRAWVIDRLERIGLVEPMPTPSLPTPVVSTPPTDNFRVAFAVDNPTFTIEITATQASGRLILESAEGTQASAEVKGRWSGESFLAMAPSHTLRIQNTAESVVDYVVTLPASVREVSVRLAGGTTVPVTMAAGGPERVIALSR